MSNYASARTITEDTAQLIKPPRRLSVADAVAEYVRCKAPNGNWERWDRETAPYMVEPMNMITDRSKRAVIFVGPARTGKSQALIDGAVGFAVKVDPSDTLIVQMSQIKAAEFGKKRITPMLENSPDMVGCLSPRGFDNNVTEKIFRAGNYLRIGHPSKTILASSDYRFVFMTDYDRWPQDIGGEGEGFGLGLKRTQTYQSRGMGVVESSPGFEILDPDWKPDPARPHEAPPTKGILSLYNLGDRRVLYWPCPSCGEYFPARFEYLRWDLNEPDIRRASKTVTCCCPHCGDSEIGPEHKFPMTQRARWVPEGCTITTDGEIHGAPIDSPYASYWMEGPAANFQRWDELVYQYLAARQDYESTGNQEKLRNTINVDQGRPYLYVRGESSRSAERLAERAETVTKRTVPEGARFLIACVDVQGGKHRRFVVQVHGIGPDGERWLVDRYNIKQSARTDEHGEPLPIDPGGYREDWHQLTRYLLRRGYPLADGSEREMMIKLVVCDHGGEAGVSDNAYHYYRELRREGLHQRLILVKGGGASQPELIKLSYPDNTKRADRKASAKGDVPLHVLASNKFKDTVSSRLDRDEPGPGYIHFPDWLGQWFYDELTAEVREDGKWIKPSSKRPNEGFDLLYYCEAGVTQLGAHKPTFWLTSPPWAREWQQNTMITGAEDAPQPKPTRPTRTRRTRYRL